jgi:hypothetical protein
LRLEGEGGEPWELGHLFEIGIVDPRFPWCLLVECLVIDEDEAGDMPLVVGPDFRLLRFRCDGFREGLLGGRRKILRSSEAGGKKEEGWQSALH